MIGLVLWAHFALSSPEAAWKEDMRVGAVPPYTLSPIVWYSPSPAIVHDPCGCYEPCPWLCWNPAKRLNYRTATRTQLLEALQHCYEERIRDNDQLQRDLDALSKTIRRVKP